MNVSASPILLPISRFFRLPRFVRSYGFTLIELLITTSILMLMIGGATVSYTKFVDRERIAQTAALLKSDLRLAQNKAIAGEKPILRDGDGIDVPCLKLNGYAVAVAGDGRSYTVTGQCDNGSIVSMELVRRTLASSVFVSPLSTSIVFQPLTGSISVPQTFTIASPRYAYQMSIAQTGSIQEKGFCTQTQLDASGNFLTCTSAVQEASPPPPPGPVAVSINSYSATNLKKDQASILVSTNIASLITVKYGKSPTNITKTATDSLASPNHTVTLKNLDNKTTYYYKIIATSEDKSSTITSAVDSFTTPK